MRLSEFVTALKSTGRGSDRRSRALSQKAAEYLREVREASAKNKAEQKIPPESAGTWRNSIERHAVKEIISRGNIPAKNGVFERCLSQAAEWAAKRPLRWLFITGTVGSGKSTLAKAVSAAVSGGYAAMRATEANWIKPEELAARAGAKWLLIDDLGTEQADIRQYGNSVSPIAEILMERYDRMLPTVITTNEPESAFAGIYGDRIADRLREMCTIIVMEGESFRKGGAR